MEYKEITVVTLLDIPINFTGVANLPYGKTWLKEGKWHRTDGPAVVWHNGKTKEWHIESRMYAPGKLELLTRKSIILNKDKGKHGLVWLRFLTETEIEEFPIIPGMKDDVDFAKMFNQLGLSV